MAVATTIKNSILDHYNGKSTWTAPAARWLGLSSTTPTEAGANVTEPSGGAYARVQLQNADMDVAASGATTNNAKKSFPQASADWVAGADLTNLVIFTASSGGTFIGCKALAAAKPALTGDTLEINIGDLDMSVGGAA
jgi:hypothetical protein